MRQLAIAATMCLCSAAPGDKPALRAASSQRIEAISATPVQLAGRLQDGRIQLHEVGPSMPLRKSMRGRSIDSGVIPGDGSCQTVVYAGCPQSSVLVFDAFEPDPVTGAPTDTGAIRCGGVGSGRWHFGDSHLNPHYVNDMRLCSGAGGEAYGVDIAWRWGVSPKARPMKIAIFTAEDFDDTCRGEPASGDLGGILYVFEDSLGGDFHANLDLCGTGLAHRLPANGSGAYLVLFGDSDNVAFYLDGFAGTQPFLWGTDPERPGIQSEVQWDDDNPTDGVHTPPGECYSYLAGLCPFPLGGMLAFRGLGDCVPCDTNCDGAVNSADVGTFLSLLSGASVPCSPCGGDCNGDGLVNNLDVQPFVNCLAVCK